MAATYGRYLRIAKNNVTIAQCQSKSIKVNNEVIDVTNDDSDAFRVLMGLPSLRSLDISLEGLADRGTLRDLGLDDLAGISTSRMLTDITIVSGEFSISGNFMMTSYEESGSYDDAVKFSCELQSSGAWNYTIIPA